jgi:hypothetical protein
MDKFSKAVQSNAKVTGGVVDPSARVRVTVKVSEADYVPAGLVVRSRIDAWMFTAECGSDLLSNLDKDNKVSSVGVATKVRATQ